METEKQHPVFAPLDLKIQLARRAVDLAKTGDTFAEQERNIIDEIDRLQKELALVRRRREGSPSLLASRQAELARLEKVREACSANPDVAQAVWLKLLMERDGARKKG